MKHQSESGRIWIDGCFDVCHFGHANALRQAKEMGEYLVVGVHSDEEITKYKGIPIMNERERIAVLESFKWVDEIVSNAPYCTDLQIVLQHNCEFVVHGDDPVVTTNGKDPYEEIKAAGKYMEFHRTKAISTTELVGRMLLMTKDHHHCDSSEAVNELQNYPEKNVSPFTALSSFYATTKRIAQFCPNSREPLPTDRVIYVDGDFDLFHAGHAALLRKAKELGSYLVVGIHEDSEVNRIKGSNFPVMNLHERVLGVLACKYVDEVIIGAPYSVEKDLMERMFNISLVLHGNTSILPDAQGNDPYSYPKSVGKFLQISHEFDYLSLSTIIQRIVQRRQEYEERNLKKQAREVEFLAQQQQKIEK